MNTRTWNVKLMATEDHPETTIDGLSQATTAKLLRELMYGPGLCDRDALRTAALDAGASAAAAGIDRHESPLAA